MMNSQNIIFTGSMGLLASHLMALCVLDSKTILCPIHKLDFDRFSDILRQTISSQNPDFETDEINHRIKTFVKQIDLSDLPNEAEIWYFAQAFADKSEKSHLNQTLNAATKKNTRIFNYVSTPYSGFVNWKWITDFSPTSYEFFQPELPEFPITRFFNTSLTVSEMSQFDMTPEGFLYFLVILYDLKTEIEERIPEYFEYRALRYFASNNATVNLIRTDQAAKIIQSISRERSSGNYFIGSPRNIPFNDIAEMIGTTFDLSLLAREDDERINAIDKLFNIRLRGFEHILELPFNNEWEESCRLTGIKPDSLIIDEEERERLFISIRESLDNKREILNQQVSSFPANFDRRELERDEHPLVYYKTGSGKDTVVLLNALGQGPYYWLRLIEYLRKRYNILIWNLRGVHEPPDQFGIKDQCRDLESILENEGVRECHIVAWCTGPKIAVEYYHQHPQTIRSMVFLNTTLKSFTSPKDLDTPYEKNFEPLCKILDERPTMAESIMNSLKLSVDNNLDLIDETDDEDISQSVLALMNKDMFAHVNHPFSDTSSLVNYARQVLDFWTYDMREKINSISIPTLLLCTEHDQIAAPQASEVIAKLLPTVRLLYVPGATHYFLYDRPNTTADLIETFFEKTEVFGNGNGLENSNKLAEV